MITHLVVPGLLGVFPRFEQVAKTPRLPALERLLARADPKAGPASYPEALFHLFGVSGDPNATAPICFAADSGSTESRYLLHADPIHLRPDQDRLLAFDFYHQPLGEGEAAPFVDAFNRHFAGDGLELIAPHPTRWYLAIEQEPRLRSHPLAEVIGRNIDLFLPGGEDAGQWRAWMNETQMLFHALPENGEREAQGRQAINGLWFSGGGHPPGSPSRGFAKVHGDCCLLQGLNALAGVPGKDRLVVENRPGRAVLDGDREAWSEALAELDEQLTSMMGDELRLYTCDSQAWHWRPGMRRRWWRRTHHLSKIVDLCLNP